MHVSNWLILLTNSLALFCASLQFPSSAYIAFSKSTYSLYLRAAARTALYFVDQRASERRLTATSLCFVAVFFSISSSFSQRKLEELKILWSWWIIRKKLAATALASRAQHPTRYSGWAKHGRMFYPLLNALIFTRHVASIAIWLTAGNLTSIEFSGTKLSMTSAILNPVWLLTDTKVSNLSARKDGKMCLKVMHNWSACVISGIELIDIEKHRESCTSFRMIFIILFLIMLISSSKILSDKYDVLPCPLYWYFSIWVPKNSS